MPEPESTCPHCHAELEPEAKFCGACGRAVRANAGHAAHVPNAPSAMGATGARDPSLEDTTPAKKVPAAVARVKPAAAGDSDGGAAVVPPTVSPEAAPPTVDAEAAESSEPGDVPSEPGKAAAPATSGAEGSPLATVGTEPGDGPAASDADASEPSTSSADAEPEVSPGALSDAPDTRDTTKLDRADLPSAGLRGTQMGIGLGDLLAKQAPRADAANSGPGADAPSAPQVDPAGSAAAAAEAAAEPTPAPAQPAAGATLKPSAALPAASPPAKSLNFAKTMMGFDPNQILGEKRAGGGPAEAAAPDNPLRPMARTMLGLNPGAAKPGDVARPAPSAANDPAQINPQFPIDRAAGSGPGARPPMARTMLGLAADPGSAAAGPAAPAGRGILQGTLMGLPLAPPNERDGGSVAAGAAGESATGESAVVSGVGMARTMLGMARLDAQEPKGAPSAAALQAGRTMLGVARAGAAADPGATTDERIKTTERVGVERAMTRTRTRTGASARHNARVLVPLFAATLLAVGATLYLLVRSAGESASDVSAKIVTTEAGEALLLEVPSASPGAKVRFGGQEKPLQAGRASFALAADSLRVGDNLVLADVVQPDGSTKPVRITLAVFYRIWVDTAGLRAERQALDVIVTALPGTQVTLDGELLKLDDEGRGVRTYPLDVVSEAKSGVIEHVVRYRMQPPSGETLVDELRTRIPVAMMQIDKPGREVVTDRDSIEIAGAVAKDAKLAIDGASVPVQDGRFLYRLKLPAPGDYAPRVVASAPGKAPLGVALKIKRVRDLNAAAADFATDPSIGYVKLAGNPAIYRGQKIGLEGRVYATDPRGAESVIQMFVRPCPKSRRCPVWVSDPHANDVAVDSWVRVLGVVQGEQQFRSEKNEIVTVPKIEAQFVLPAKP